MTPLVLASTSPYRAELIAKLGLEFHAKAPLCDEDSYKSKIKDPVDLATTLAEIKAKSLSTEHNCVIGGDQVIALGSEIIGKPGSFEKACAQLQKMQGKSHRLITAICVIFKGQTYPILDVTEVHMRALTASQIETYVHMDTPLDCAGSYKIERSGITLIQELNSRDFSAIQGVPLIELTHVLSNLGYVIPSPPRPLKEIKI